MQSVVNILIILVAMGFLALVLNELAKSQKNSVPTKPKPVSKFTYVMRVRFKGHWHGERLREQLFEANSLEYMQQALNNIVFWSISDATVRMNGEVSHVMDETGVLREV